MIDVVVNLSARAFTTCDLNDVPPLVAVISTSPPGTLNMNATPSAEVSVAVPLGKVESAHRLLEKVDSARPFVTDVLMTVSRAHGQNTRYLR